jgi:hypothetical protein
VATVAARRPRGALSVASGLRSKRNKYGDGEQPFDDPADCDQRYQR